MACGEKVGEEPRLFLYGVSGEEGEGEGLTLYHGCLGG